MPCSLYTMVHSANRSYCQVQLNHGQPAYSRDCILSEQHVTLHIKMGKMLQKAGQFRKIIINMANEPSLCPVRGMQTVLLITPTAFAGCRLYFPLHLLLIIMILVYVPR